MLCQGSHRELIPSVRFGTLGETLAPDAECLVAQRDAVSAGFYQPLKAAAGSKAGELSDADVRRIAAQQERIRMGLVRQEQNRRVSGG